jgi:hypothetical protein
MPLEQEAIDMLSGRRPDKKLYLGSRGLTASDVRTLAEYLTTNRTLTQLRQGSHVLLVLAARHCVRRTEQWRDPDTSVHSLDRNNLGVGGARHLADALRVNATLQTLE